MKPSAELGGVSRPSSSAWTASLGTPCRAGERREGDQVPVVGVDAARADEADHVERAAALERASARREERRPRVERPVGDGGIDARQVLEHRPAGPEVEVADLRVAHLAGRQPDRLLRCLERGVRPARQQAAPDRHRRGGDRVAGRVVPDPEPVEDDQDDGSGSPVGHPASPRAPAVMPGPADDAGHLVGLERGAADERAVDRRLGQELADVHRRDAAAVQHRHVAGQPAPAHRVEAGPDRVGHRRGVHAGRVAARADRPDRLVGDDEPGLRGAARLDPGERPADLPIDHVDRPPGLAIGQLLADAQDRSQARRRAPGRPCAPMSSSVSPASRRRSECPTITHVASPASIGAATSPVYAPASS